MSEKKKDELPKSLEGVLGDIDITEELKRRLTAKKLAKDLDCERKSLSGTEILAAARRRQQKLYDDVEEDIKLSKKVVESLVEKRLIEEHQRAAAREVLDAALQRQRDKEIAFVPVSGLDPRQAAQRVIRLKEEYAEVEPVDLSGVFDNVNRICDLHVERLQHIMNVKKAVDLDGVPDEIRFVIPNVDLPPPAETDPSDLRFTMARYIHFDSMPEELQQVVRSYLTLRHGVDTLALRRFKRAIADLARRAEATFDDGPPDG